MRVAALFLILTSIGACNSAFQERTQNPSVAEIEGEHICVHVVNEFGKPMPGAKVGWGLSTYQRGDESAPPTLGVTSAWRGNQEASRLPERADNKGNVSLNVANIFRFSNVRSIYVLDTATAHVGLFTIRSNKLPSEVTIQTTPICVVRGRVSSSDLTTAGNRIGESYAYVGTVSNSIILSNLSSA